MDLAPEYTDRLNSLSPQPNLQEVLLVMGGRSLDDSDDDDDSDEEDRDPRLLPRNCAFYNTKTSTNIAFFAHIKMSSLFKFRIRFTTEICCEISVGLLETVWQMCRRSLNVVLTEKRLGGNEV